MWYILTAWNMFVFLLYGFDKARAKRGGGRIRERTLLFCAFAMGGVGALLGMELFRHKTKHASFTFLVPIALICNIAVLALLMYASWISL